jgi:hypothetical protein
MRIPVRVFVVCVAATVLAAPAALGQRDDNARAEGRQLKIRKLAGAVNRDRVLTPYYNTSVSRGSREAEEWAQLSVEYMTAPEWIDELVIEFHAMTLKRVKGKNAYSLYRKVVRYIDVERGRDHVATAYLRPAALKRYGDVVAVAVEISVGGRKEDEASQKRAQKLPDDWWRNPAVTESESVALRQGYLLDRSESPWALINVDYHEVIK